MGFSFHSAGSIKPAKECWNESHTINWSARAAKTKEKPAGVNRRALIAGRGKSRSLRYSDGSDSVDNFPPSTVGRLDVHKATGNLRFFFSNAEIRSGFIKPLDCCAPPLGAALHWFIAARDLHANQSRSGVVHHATAMRLKALAKLPISGVE
jgi:hypothetical protein